MKLVTESIIGSLCSYTMNAKKIFEIQNFQRGLDPKEALQVGRIKDAIELSGLEEEYSDDGPMQYTPKLNFAAAAGDLQTWNESLDDEETEYTLNNWEDCYHPFLYAIIEEGGKEKGWGDGVYPAKHIEGSMVKWNGKFYDIPVIKKNTYNES